MPGFGRYLALAVVLLGGPAHASNLFEDTSVLELELRGPLATLIAGEEGNPEFAFALQAGDSSHPVEVRVRGKSRVRVCEFPPLRIRFPGDSPPDSPFAGQERLKLVTHCGKTDRFQGYLLKEYAAYKILNTLTDLSYRVRLVRVNYVDTNAPEAPPLQRFGFFIESAVGFAQRTGGGRVATRGVSLASFDVDHLALVFIFQYIIGNTDWSLVLAIDDDKCCHNGDIFDIGPQRYYVPFDFDLAGLVNARYAKPDPSLNISRVTQRKYRGHCVSSDALAAALGDIKAKRGEVLGVIDEVPGLTEKDRKIATRFLDRFFERATDEGKLLKMFERRCIV